MPWNLLAAHHRVETRFSTIEPMISPVGATGHMQFMPCTWVGWSHPTCSGLGKGDISQSELTSSAAIARYGGYGVDGTAMERLIRIIWRMQFLQQPSTWLRMAPRKAGSVMQSSPIIMRIHSISNAPSQKKGMGLPLWKIFWRSSFNANPVKRVRFLFLCGIAV